jgi:excisionase family DNA binding protein
MVRGSVMMGSGPGQGRKGRRPHKRYMNGHMMSPLAVGRSPFSGNLSEYQQAFPEHLSHHWHAIGVGRSPAMWYTTKQVALMLGYSLTKTKHLVLSGQIRSIKDGGNRRILPEYVDEYVARKKEEVIS